MQAAHGRAVMAAVLILGAVASAAALAQSFDARASWYRWPGPGWGAAAWSHAPFLYDPWVAYGPWPPAPWPFAGYRADPGHWYSPCYPFVSCAAAHARLRLWARREQRAAALRDQAADAGYRAAQGASQQQALPAPELAPESALQPRYRDSGKINPGFEHSGEYLPQLPERRRTPHAPAAGAEELSR